MAYLWQWFQEISLSLAVSGFGPPVATWSDVASWAALTGTALEPWEARALARLSSERAMAIAEKTPKPGAHPSTSPPPRTKGK